MRPHSTPEHQQNNVILVVMKVASAWLGRLAMKKNFIATKELTYRGSLIS